jgi:hypothetical protein
MKLRLDREQTLILVQRTVYYFFLPLKQYMPMPVFRFLIVNPQPGLNSIPCISGEGKD